MEVVPKGNLGTLSESLGHMWWLEDSLLGIYLGYNEFPREGEGLGGHEVPGQGDSVLGQPKWKGAVMVSTDFSSSSCFCSTS